MFRSSLNSPVNPRITLDPSLLHWHYLRVTRIAIGPIARYVTHLINLDQSSSVFHRRFKMAAEAGSARKKYAKADQKFKAEYSKTYPIIAKSKLGDLYGFCSVCQTDFSIRHGGLYDVKKHVASKKHESLSKTLESTKKVSSFFCPQQDQSVIRAEVLFTEFLIEHAVPLAVSDHSGKLFRHMFPDSKVYCQNGPDRFGPVKL